MKPLVAITGGLGDIGRAIGEAYAAQGDQVAVCDLADSAPDGFPWHYFPADVQSEESLRAWFDAMEKEFGRPPTLVVVNAGVHCTNGHGGCLETGFAEWTRTIGVNLTGAWLTAREGALRQSLVKSMALELAPRGIRVNEIAPGYVDAGLSGKIFEENGDFAERARQAVPCRKLVTVAEVARAAVFLTDPSNPNLTGTTLILDGGISLMHGPQDLK